MSHHIARIVVALDGSEASLRALEVAIGLAEDLKAKLTILEIVEDFGPLPGYYDAAPAGEDRVDWIANQRFRGASARLKETDVAWDRRVEGGVPAEVICEVAEAYDLVIVGARGLSAVGRFLIGSVSDRVVHHSPCSVLVVR